MLSFKKCYFPTENNAFQGKQPYCLTKGVVGFNNGKDRNPNVKDRQRYKVLEEKHRERWGRARGPTRDPWRFQKKTYNPLVMKLA